MKEEKMIALVGDFLYDSKNVILLEKQLDSLGVEYKYFKDIDDVVDLDSVVIILNNKCEYEFDADSFIRCVISNRIPIIVVYTDVDDNESIHNSISFTDNTIGLWKKIPSFADERYMVATVHIPLCDLMQIIRRNDFVKGTMLDPSDYYLLKRKE